MTIVISLAVLAGGATVLFVHGSDSPETTTLYFMTALAKGDVNTLCDLSYLPGESPQKLHEDWDFAVHTAGRYFNFQYTITGSTESDANNAAVTMEYVKNFQHIGAYAEPVTIPLVKDKDKWKVDVAATDRSIFPALPR